MSVKAAERTSLILHFGMLIAPIKDLAFRSAPATGPDYRLLEAKLYPDLQAWVKESQQFARFGDYAFNIEVNDIIGIAKGIVRQTGHLAKHFPDNDQNRQESLQRYVLKCEKDIIDAIDKIPIEWESQLLAAGTPFSTYLKIADAINAARTRVHYFDRYLDPDFFPLYLRSLARDVEVRLVTTRGSVNFGVQAISNVASLAAKEFGDFRLIEVSPRDMHDRNLRIDQKVFHLGTSTNDAGSKPTNFAVADSSNSANLILDDVIANGTVVH
ncbi:hypothetical protein [Novipirellula sp.]|uniref:hypothetical protein n=1 Tax=Novipirellula sp. TaxID=2795430 RepID=UPI00356A2FEC